MIGQLGDVIGCSGRRGAGRPRRRLFCQSWFNPSFNQRVEGSNGLLVWDARGVGWLLRKIYYDCTRWTCFGHKWSAAQQPHCRTGIPTRSRFGTFVPSPAARSTLARCRSSFPHEASLQFLHPPLSPEPRPIGQLAHCTPRKICPSKKSAREPCLAPSFSHAWLSCIIG